MFKKDEKVKIKVRNTIKSNNNSKNNAIYKECVFPILEKASIKSHLIFFSSPKDESVQYISQNTCSDFLKKAEARIREELWERGQHRIRAWYGCEQPGIFYSR